MTRRTARESLRPRGPAGVGAGTEAETEAGALPGARRGRVRMARLSGVGGVLVLSLLLLTPQGVLAAGNSIEGGGEVEGTGRKTLRVEVVGAPPDAVTATANLEEGRWEIAPPSGFVRLTYGDSAAAALSMRFEDGETGGNGEQWAELTGLVVVARADLYATADRLHIGLQEGRYVLSGGVRLYQWASARTLHPERLEIRRTGSDGNGRDGNDGDDDTPSRPPMGSLWSEWADGANREPLVVEGERVSYDDGSGHITGSGGVHVRDEAMEAWADRFSYDPDADRAVLEGSVRAVLENQTIEESPRIVVNLSEDRATIAGPWTATIVIEDESDE